MLVRELATAPMQAASSLRTAAAKIYWTARSLAEKWSVTKHYYEWKGRRFDRRYGIETSQVVEVGDLDMQPQEAQHATRYRATSPGFLQHVLKRNRIMCEDFVFVDLGSGKGRVLVEAASFPFRRIVGVELSERLHEAAKDSLARAEGHHLALHRVELRCQSAVEFDPPAEHTIFYLYNPFDEAVLKTVMANLERSLSQVDRRIVIVYLNPRWPGAIDQTRLFDLVDTGRYGPDDYRVYVTRNAGAA
jgi:16S rRNA G966 N2-methylase RsmD